MTRLDWSAAHRGLCVVCGDVVGGTAAPICRSCHKPARVILRRIGKGPQKRNGTFIADAVSDCCDDDVDIAPGVRITCSENCHERFVEELEREFGREKVVVDEATGRRHLVPTRQIIERGVRQENLKFFPEAE